MSKIDLRSGCTFDLLNPDPSTIFIEDIAWGLANTCRFGGQCSEFYSVAQHSVLVSQIIPSLEALMHDSPEAYLGDVVGPLKRLLPDYKKFEDSAENAIRRRFGLFEFNGPSIKDADMRALRTEQRDLIRSYDSSWNRLHQPLPLKIIPQPPNLAAINFLVRFNELGGRYA